MYLSSNFLLQKLHFSLGFFERICSVFSGFSGVSLWGWVLGGGEELPWWIKRSWMLVKASWQEKQGKSERSFDFI